MPEGDSDAVMARPASPLHPKSMLIPGRSWRPRTRRPPGPLNDLELASRISYIPLVEHARRRVLDLCDSRVQLRAGKNLAAQCGPGVKDPKSTALRPRTSPGSGSRPPTSSLPAKTGGVVSKGYSTSR